MNTPTKAGKAHFVGSAIAPIPFEPGQFLMTALRSHDPCHSTTVCGFDDRDRVSFMVVASS
jgi:hypothetical protein